MSPTPTQSKSVVQAAATEEVRLLVGGPLGTPVPQGTSQGSGSASVGRGAFGDPRSSEHFLGPGGAAEPTAADMPAHCQGSSDELGGVTAVTL